MIEKNKQITKPLKTFGLFCSLMLFFLIISFPNAFLEGIEKGMVLFGFLFVLFLLSLSLFGTVLNHFLDLDSHLGGNKKRI